MSFQPAIPKDAASLILLDDAERKILWAQRNPNLRFLGGFHSFPGGKVDETDLLCPVRNCDERETAGLIACAARETFEEVGVLLVRNGDRLTKGQFPLLHDDLISGRSTFPEILEHWGLWLDAEDFKFAGVWTTPEFSRMRFRTTFFVARCPSKQTPYAAISELERVAFADSREALDKWKRASVLIAPPVLSALRAFEFAKEAHDTVAGLAAKFGDYSKARTAEPRHLELNSRLVCFPVRTKTLPPATHTNCYIVGRKRFAVIDAATPFEDEQKQLFETIFKMIESGSECEAIVVSHLHPDHVGGETALKAALNERFGIDVPIAGHAITIDSLRGKVVFDTETPNTYLLQDSDGKAFELEVLHTPGHARGHLCFYDRDLGFLLTSDNVVGEGTVVIAPPEGNMRDYLDSLEMMKNLPGLRSLAGSHGAAISDAKAKIESYIGHRLKRERQIKDSIANGGGGIGEIVEAVYPGLDPGLIHLAEKTVEAHIEKLVAENSLPGSWKAFSSRQHEPKGK